MAQVLTTDPAVFEFSRGGGATIQIQTGAADATVDALGGGAASASAFASSA